MLTIGDLSRRTGVKIPTIRYYEQMGLLLPVERSRSNRRQYSASDQERLAFIKHARTLGFPIDAVRDLLTLHDEPEMLCVTAHSIARRQLDTVREKMQRLRTLETELERIAAIFHTGHHVKDCSVIRALGDQGACADDP